MVTRINTGKTGHTCQKEDFRQWYFYNIETYEYKAIP